MGDKKRTGLMRRIDDLGRVVIPKEVRKLLNIREGDPLEVFVDIEQGRVYMQLWDEPVDYETMYKEQLTENRKLKREIDKLGGA